MASYAGQVDLAATKLYTVIFPMEGDGADRRLLLGLKKRGMGMGLWNGFGGKPEPGETLDACARRELQEECGLRARDLRYVGVLLMACAGHRDMAIFVYTAHDLVGDVVESDEMQPQWFPEAAVPYASCHQEAPLWWPAMLDGERFVARFVFDDADGIEHDIQRADDAQLAGLLALAQP
ncbi:Nudix (Nucleoside diphosphate linked moiety X)-type motif 1 [Coemansia nantahalensis]|uniref:Nudix (Nucleoside diphosphate linked moiety X)-type motif 1 n=1 Tax=Coemansia nantahalensis TaxID=2789366 RepID=A0ACC1JT42_9FUNG|nr:Nudix (Nucleoside diphosphate linked moiety X)-type motif 1 [Coemansia nantahalensis]